MITTLNADGVGTVLIVDGCPRMRKEVRAKVEDLAAEVIETEDGASAIAAYRRHQPDWVTVELAMRPMDGLTVAQEILSHDPLARIIVVTACDTNACRAVASDAGVCGYVLKDDLSKIRDLLAPAELDGKKLPWKEQHAIMLLTLVFAFISTAPAPF